MSGITTHVLDLGSGLPAAGVRVRLERKDPAGWMLLTDAATEADGRVRDLLPRGEKLTAATYRLTYAAGDYFASRQVKCFYGEIPVVFAVADPDRHHHVPLLLSPFGYSTYRGS
jgi:5-hydroxyisourate hydrolase